MIDKKGESLPSLQVEGLNVNYDKTPVLWDITLSVPQGKVVGIVGPNGAGKTTLVKAALGLLRPLSGKIEFFGKPLEQSRQRMAYVPQKESVDWDFPITVKELVLMGRYGKLGLFHRPKQEDHETAERYLELVGMTSYAKRQINQLSRGQQQRVFIARALTQEADVYFMDEPLAGIDLASEKVIMKLLSDLRDQGKTVFVVHHDLHSVTAYFEWVILLNMRLIACGETATAFTSTNLNLAYGKHAALFDEALKLSEETSSGS